MPTLDEVLNTYPRFILEAIILTWCFLTIHRTKEQSDKAAAWAIIGLVTANILRNLAQN